MLGSSATRAPSTFGIWRSAWTRPSRVPPFPSEPRPGQGLDRNQIAFGQHGPEILRRQAEPLVAQGGPRPLRLRQGYLALGAVLQQDFGGIPGHVRDDRQPERRQRGRSLGRGEGGTEIPLETGDRSAPAVASVVGEYAPPQGGLADALQGRLDGRPHRQAARVELVLAVEVVEFPTHLLREPLRLEEFGRTPRPDRQRLVPGLLGLQFRDPSVGDHAVQHPVAPFQGLLPASDRMVVVRGLGQHGEEGGLREGQFAEGFVEVVHCRRRDPVRGVSQVDLIQVQLEDRLLAQGALESDRQYPLLDLARDRHLVAEQEVLGDLLGDGRTPDRTAGG